MPRYVAFLRGVSPLNCRMPDLKRCFEQAGYTNVKTLLSSGNVAFDARAAREASLERKAEAAMHETLGRRFYTIVRASTVLRDLIAASPYASFPLAATSKCVVSFLRSAPEPHHHQLPIEAHGASILGIVGREIYSAYVPGDEGPAFMRLIEKTFGSDITTRTWDTVRKCAAA